MGSARAFLMGLVVFLIGLAFFTGYFPNATYSYWLAEAVANGTIFIGVGLIVMAIGVLG
jgi:hypothetical protein